MWCIRRKAISPYCQPPSNVLYYISTTTSAVSAVFGGFYADFRKKDTPEAAIRSLVIQLSRQGIGTARADSAGRTMLTLVGETWTLDEQRLLALPYVAEVKRLTPVWRLASRQTHPEDTVVSVGDAQIGKGFCLMAGPCAVESALQMQGVARAVKAAGGLVLRGGAYKPRTSPYAFQGFGAPALELLAQTGREVGLPTVSEITDAAQLPQFEQVDMLQVGARNMQNYELLRALGQQSKPVLLKRAVGATVEELLQSAEYILAGGNPNVVLCERGVRSFSKTSRAALDVSAIPVLKRMTHLPVIVDPSHAAGEAALVPPLALAAVAAGADGLLIEVHDRPAAALSDAAQSLSCTAFAELAEKIKRYAKPSKRDHRHSCRKTIHRRIPSCPCSCYRYRKAHQGVETGSDGFCRRHHSRQYQHALENVYVYIHEMDPENVRKTAPIVRIDWTTIPDRTQQAKNAIMTALSDKLAEITGENKMEINGILINDIPLACGMLGGISRADNCDW